jgi:hypothetical protein
MERTTVEKRERRAEHVHPHTLIPKEEDIVMDSASKVLVYVWSL